MLVVQRLRREGGGPAGGEKGGGSPKLPSSPLLVKYWTPLGDAFLPAFFPPRGVEKFRDVFLFLRKQMKKENSRIPSRCKIGEYLNTFIC